MHIDPPECTVQIDDSAGIEQAANTIGNLTAQMTAAHAKAQAAFYQTLTPEQQEEYKEILKDVVSDLQGMSLGNPSEVCYQRVIRTQYGYVVQDFTYRKFLDKAKAYFEGIGIALCGRVAEFEYINMDEAVRRGLSVVEQIRSKDP